MTITETSTDATTFDLEVTHDASGDRLAEACGRHLTTEARRLGAALHISTSYRPGSPATADSFASGRVQVTLSGWPAADHPGGEAIDSHLRAEAIAAVRATDAEAVVWGIV